jgi:hypothetical protein
MASLFLSLPAAENTMKNTIDDADYIISLVDLIVINQFFTNSRHSHSIVNELFLAFIFNDLFSYY